MTVIQTQAAACKLAERRLSIAGVSAKNDALTRISQALLAHTDEILSANQKDLDAAHQAGLRPAMLDRLQLTAERIAAIADSVLQVAALPDPIGEVTHMTQRPNGLMIGKKRVPLGVIGIIYEARPNVTVDAAVLCLKSGNTCLLRGGKEAIHSNTILVSVMRQALESAGLPADCVCLVEDTSRSSAGEMMGLTEYLDVLIPRGGRGLIRSVVEHSRVPVIRTGEGVCSVYVDTDADLQMACDIIYNAKCSRPSVCNAAENLLVARSVAKEFLPMCAARLAERNCRLIGDPEVCAILGAGIQPAADEDWDTEYGDYILSIKLVQDLDEALDFIALHSTGHSECIVTNHYPTAQRFLNEVDAAAVYVNASTRFTDGGEFGLGAEIGISTQKLHARGPMGLEELTSYKYIVYGSGQVR